MRDFHEFPHASGGVPTLACMCGVLDGLAEFLMNICLEEINSDNDWRAKAIRMNT